MNISELPFIDTTKYNVLDVVRFRTSQYGTFSRVFINDKSTPYYIFEPRDFFFTPKKMSFSQIRHFKNEMSLKGIFCAIPEGVYDLDLKHKSIRYMYRKQYQFSNGLVPIIRDIPAYSGVCIHIGNNLKDTSGCLLPGLSFNDTQVFQSTSAFTTLYSRLDSFKYPTKIRISDCYQPELFDI